MEYISSDTNVWIDFFAIEKIDLPFRLPYTYIMNKDAIDDELLSPPELKPELIKCGLKPVEISIEEFELAQSYGRKYVKLSVYDRIALSIAKNRNIVLLTGDRALRKAGEKENVKIMGTLGIIDQLFKKNLIDIIEYKDCLQRLKRQNGGTIRLPDAEIESRLKNIY